MTELADRYRLGEVLGRGGVADVYRGRDLVLDRDVAVKVLRETVDDTDRSRFVGEARMLARLSHVGLVTVLDAGISGAQPFLVMELVEGPTLATALADGPLPPDQVGRIGAQLAEVIAYAHEQGVVHRDVKPSNVLLGPTGEVKLADFGIARLVGDTVRHTRTGTTIGTPAYVSPEQAQGAHVGPPTDVYSLGLVLLEALTGQRAFPGTPVESALARLHRPPSIPEDLPAEWRGQLAAMTATDPAGRPTAAAAAAVLEGLSTTPAATKVLDVPPAGSVVAADATPTERLEAPAHAVRGLPARAGAALAAAAVAILVAAVVGVVVLGDRGDDELPDPPATSPTSTEPGTDTGTTTDSESLGTTTPAVTNEPPGSHGKHKPKHKGKDKDGKDGKGGKGKGKG